MKLSYLSLLALAPLAASAAETKQYWVAPTEGNTTHWVKGFSLDNPATLNYDADKLNNKNPGTAEGNAIQAAGGVADGPLCWAAAAANVAAEWEAKNVETVRETQKRDPKSAQEIFSDFTANVVSMSGSATSGARWYFVGTGDVPSKKDSGAYYKDEVSISNVSTGFFDLVGTGWELNEEEPANVADSWDPEVYQNNRLSIYQQWTSALVNRIEDGYSICLKVEGKYLKEDGKTGSYGHAITLWGVEVDANDCVTRMWLTDSDDATSPSTGGDLGLFSVSCTLADVGHKMLNGAWHFDDSLPFWLEGVQGYLSLKSDVPVVDANGDEFYWYKGYDETADLGDYVTDVYGIKVTSLHYAENPIVPEPATATLSLLELAGRCARRRRH